MGFYSSSHFSLARNSSDVVFKLYPSPVESITGSSWFHSWTQTSHCSASSQSCLCRLSWSLWSLPPGNDETHVQKTVQQNIMCKITRAVKVNVLVYEIIVAEINAIKYFNAVNATLFTSGVFPLTRNCCVPAVSQLGETELKMERAEGLLGGKFLFKRQNDGTIVKTKVVCSICQAKLSDHRSSSSLLKLRSVTRDVTPTLADCPAITWTSMRTV